MIAKYLNNTKASSSMTAEELYVELGGNKLDLGKNEVLINSEIIYACVNLIANSIARMPFNLLENTDKGKVKVNNELAMLLKRRPNKFMTPSAFKKYIIIQMLVYGESFVWIKTKNGRPTELLPLDSSCTRVEKMNGNYFIVTQYDNKQETLNYETVLHFRDTIKDYEGKRAISRVDVAMEKLNVIYKADKMIENLYANGGNGVIKGAINTTETLSNDAKKVLKKAFTNVLNTDGNGIAVLDGGMSFSNFGSNSMTLQDQQFIDSQKYNREAICSVFGVNSALIGATENVNYSNMTQIQRQFIESLTPFLVNIEEEMSYKLISSFEQDRYFIKINTNVAMRDDATTRASYYTTMTQNGLMTREEVRDLEDLNFIEGTEELLMSLNYVPLKYWKEYTTKRDTGETTEEIIKVEE